MAEPDDRRRAPRIKTGPNIYFSSAREEGPAGLVDISAVGALLEWTGSKPSVGEPVRMSVLLPNSPKRFQVVGKVSRHTQDGFAIEFDRPNPQIYEMLVEDAASATRVAESGQQEGATPEEADEGTGAAASRRDGVESTDDLQALPDVEEITKVWIDWRHKAIRVQWRGRLNRPIWDVHLPPSAAKRLALWLAGILAEWEEEDGGRGGPEER